MKANKAEAGTGVPSGMMPRTTMNLKRMRREFIQVLIGLDVGVTLLSLSGAICLPSQDARTSFSACGVFFGLVHRGPYVGNMKINSCGACAIAGVAFQ